MDLRPIQDLGLGSKLDLTARECPSADGPEPSFGPVRHAANGCRRWSWSHLTELERVCRQRWLDTSRFIAGVPRFGLGGAILSDSGNQCPRSSRHLSLLSSFKTRLSSDSHQTHKLLFYKSPDFFISVWSLALASEISFIVSSQWVCRKTKQSWSKDAKVSARDGIKMYAKATE